MIDIYHSLNRICFYLFFSFILFSANAIAAPTILIVGDSLSAAYQIPPEKGWVALLEDKLKTTNPQATVINSSIVGDTTTQGLQRLPSLLSKYHPDIVILELGGNDGLRGLPISEIKANLSAMIKLCLESQTHVLLIGMQLPPNYGQAYTQKFKSNYTQLSSEFNIPLVPFFLLNVATQSTLMQQDRIHPTAEAQPLLLENVWAHLSLLLNRSPKKINQ